MKYSKSTDGHKVASSSAVLKVSDCEVVHEFITTGEDSIAALSKVGGWIFDIWVYAQSAVVMQGRSGNQNWVSVEKYNGNKMPNTRVEIYYLWCNVNF